MAGQTTADFMQMQREAEKRVLEMQRRAKSRLESKEPIATNQTAQSDPEPSVPTKKHSFLDLLNIKSFFESKDTSLVLMVLALLNSQENTDPILMLALLYVML